MARFALLELPGMSPVLEVKTPSRRYPLVVERGSLKQIAALSQDVLPDKPIFLVSQKTVHGLYGAKIKRSLGKRLCGEIVLEDGEPAKSFQNYRHVIDAMLACKPLPGAVLALGGGVCGDLAGFAAGTYRRGIPLIQVPTTLLSQVDSSVGGKTGIDHLAYKNYVGVFHQPHLVVIDPDVLKTLPQREISAGLAEVLKYGLLFSSPFFTQLESLGEKLLKPTLKEYDQIILDCCAFKAKVVAADERDENGKRALLNLGHTFGHAIETTSGLGHFLHGEAVAIGLVGAARMSHKMGICKTDFSPRVEDLLGRMNLPTGVPGGELPNLLKAVQYDKKFSASSNAFILLKAIGRSVLVRGVPNNIINEVFLSLLEETQ